MNLLLKLSLSQSILIAVFTFWIQCLKGGVPCLHIPASVSGSSALFVATWWEKLLPLLPWCSVSNPRFLFVHLAFEISSEEEVLRLGTLISMNIKVLTKYQLSHIDRLVAFENRLHSENPMLYRPAVHGNWNASSLARRALKYKFPTPTVPLTAVLPNHQVFLPDPVQHKPTKCTLSKLILKFFNFYIFFMFRTREFSSGRHLYMQL
jgi:hypothetical protein